jgi:hypothetical protein
MVDTVRSYQQDAVVVYELSPWPNPKVDCFQLDAVVLYELSPWPNPKVDGFQVDAVVLYDPTPVASTPPRRMLTQIL